MPSEDAGSNSRNSRRQTLAALAAARRSRCGAGESARSRRDDQPRCRTLHARSSRSLPPIRTPSLIAFQAQLPLENETFDPAPFAAARGVDGRSRSIAYARTQQNVVEKSRAFQTATGISHLQGVPRMVRAAQQLVRLRGALGSAGAAGGASSRRRRATAQADPVAAAGIPVPGERARDVGRRCDRCRRSRSAFRSR